MFVSVYLDDFFFYKETFEEHLQHLGMVVMMLRAENCTEGCSSEILQSTN